VREIRTHGSEGGAGQLNVPFLPLSFLPNHQSAILNRKSSIPLSGPMRPIPIILTLLLALGAVEGLAYWWMHPKPAGLGEPVLTYRPQVGRDPARSADVSPSARDDKDQAPANAPALSTSKFDVGSSKFDVPSPSSLTPLPEIVAAALPSLRCTTGTAARIDREDDVTIHVAFFEWDLSSSTNVLEAFKHLPEQCMGSIGMTLIEKAPPRSYVVRQREDVNSPASSSIQKSEINNHQSSIPASSPNPQSKIINHRSSIPLSSPNPQSEINNRQSSISPSPSTETLSFDHTIFRDQAGVIIHAFKGTWVSGANTLLGDGIRGGEEQWRQLRWRAALKRFRPAHARVAQGAVRGIRDPDLAWQSFEESMLRDLRFADP
jgi:hypothetical protein